VIELGGDLSFVVVGSGVMRRKAARGGGAVVVVTQRVMRDACKY